jgi:MSHA biogenesis protein MshG
MSIFKYHGKNQLGEYVSGEMDGDDSAIVAKRLISSGVFPIKIEVLDQKHQGGFSKKLSQKDLLLFTRQLYVLVKSGIPILRAFKSMETSNQNKILKDLYKEIYKSIDHGFELYVALQKFPDFFSVFYINLIKIGELTGRLEEVLLNLYNYLEFELQMKRSAVTAFRYPVFVLGIMALAFSVVMVFVIPAFAKVYESFHAQLPLMTRILIGTSDFVVHNGLIIFTIMALLFLGFKNYIKTKDGKLWWDGFKFRIPLVGPIIKKSALGRFSKGLSLMLKSGIPILQAFGVLIHAVDNSYISFHLNKIRESIDKGNTVYGSFKNSGIFEPLVLEMISTGEESGELDAMVGEVSSLYEKEIEYELKALSGNIEPIIFMLLGVLILIFALGVLLPSWDLSGVIIKK